MGDRREEILDEYRTRFPSALQAQVNAMAGRMAVLEAEVIKAKARVCAVNANRDAEVSELRKRIAELEAKNAQLSQDRYDALSVTTREGLLCSEWVLRTGKAERERDEARRRIADLEHDRDALLVELQRSFMKLPTVRGAAMGWDGRNLEPHVVQCADEFAILREQRDAGKKRIAELEREAKNLREFARWAIREGSWQALDLYGGDIQNMAEELGLIAEVPGGYDPDQHGESDVEPGDTFYVFTDALSERGASV